MPHYPVYINLSNQHCVVIGGDSFAEAKVKDLLKSDAQVTVIAPHLTEHLTSLVSDARITHICRAYETGDLTDAFMVISTLIEPSINQHIWQEASERNILINAMDDVPHCNFIAPSIVRQGDLTVAISTAGKAPALAVRLRQQLEQTLGPEYAQFLEWAGRLRSALSERHPDFEMRRTLWYELMDSDVLDLLRQGEENQAWERMMEILEMEKENVIL